MVRVIAHRGASATHPENTLEAFRAAADQGAHGVELDVRRTADDVLVVFHDAHLPSGRMLREVTADGLPSSVPSLAEALEACADLWVNIEIKNMPSDPDYDSEHGISVAVAALITAYDAAERVLVSSFNIDAIDRIKAVDPAIPTGWRVWAQAPPSSLIDRAVAHEVVAIHPHDLLVDQSFVTNAHRAGLAVNVWTVNEARRVRELLAFGVDGIITDQPGEVTEIVSNL